MFGLLALGLSLHLSYYFNLGKNSMYELPRIKHRRFLFLSRGDKPLLVVFHLITSV